MIDLNLLYKINKNLKKGGTGHAIQSCTFSWLLGKECQEKEVTTEKQEGYWL